MALSVFEDKSKMPRETDLSNVLGKAITKWTDLINYIQKTYGQTNDCWKNYGNASGWTYLIKLKKRTIIYLFPNTEAFILQLVLGEKAVHQALNALLSEDIKQIIRHAKPYVEGRTLRFRVESETGLGPIKQLIDIKVKQ